MASRKNSRSPNCELDKRKREPTAPPRNSKHKHGKKSTPEAPKVGAATPRKDKSSQKMKIELRLVASPVAPPRKERLPQNGKADVPKRPEAMMAPRKDRSHEHFESEQDLVEAIDPKWYKSYHSFKARLQKVEGEAKKKELNSRKKFKIEECFAAAGGLLAVAPFDSSGMLFIYAIIAATGGFCGIAYNCCKRYFCSLKWGFEKVKDVFDGRDFVKVKKKLLRWSFEKWKGQVVDVRGGLRGGASADEFPSSAPVESSGPSRDEIRAFLQALKRDKENGHPQWLTLWSRPFSSSFVKPKKSPSGPGLFYPPPLEARSLCANNNDFEDV